MKLKSAGFVLFFGLILTVANMFHPIRDGIATVDVIEYRSSQLANNNDFYDSPVQTVFTYFNREVEVLNMDPTITGFDFSSRLESFFVNGLGTRSIIDVREFFTAEELAAVAFDISKDGFVSAIRCPHEPGLDCTLGINWDRSFSKSPDMIIVAIRYSERNYAIIDQSFINERDASD